MTSRLRGRLRACAFLSGWAALVYEVLWLKDLGRILGNSAHASSLILSAYFLGLAAGSFYSARRLRVGRASLATYAALEVGIAVGAALFLVFLRFHDTLMSPLYALASAPSPLTSLVRFAVAGLFLWVPAFFMGATFPVLTDVMARREPATRGDPEGLYFMNVFGGVAGALLAGFVMPRFLGFTASYALAICVNLAIAGYALGRERRSEPVAASPDARVSHVPVFFKQNKGVFTLAFLSGFGVLALEVLWHQLFGLVTIHCVYSFAAILAVFLCALGTGAFLVSRFHRRGSDVFPVTRRVLAFGAVATAATPLLFYALTGGFAFAYQQRSFAGYLGNVFWIAFGTFFLPTVALGLLFPLLFRAGAREGGAYLGVLSGMNTLGAILGSLVAGFGLSRLGVVEGIFLVAALYVVAMQSLPAVGKKARWNGIVPLGLVSVLYVAAKSLPFVPLSETHREKLLALSTGPYGMVSVISAEPEIGAGRRVKDLFIRLNNFYTLGGVGSLHDERRQGELPLFFAPRAESVFFLGMGTGITAGGVLHHPVKKVVVTEIVPEVVRAARDFFEPYVGSLFHDPRVSVLADDGRAVLAMHEERYDVIVADLFDPWGAGIGTLYTRENFALAKERLNPGGIFVQWLPLYQLTEEGLGIVARTMLDVFPHVVAWRGNFHPDKPTLALVGYADDMPKLDGDALENRVAALGGDSPERRLRVAETFLAQSEYAWQNYTAEKKAFVASLFPQVRAVFPYGFYVGNVSARRDVFAGYPVNTMDRPVFEYLSPEFLGMQKDRKDVWMTGEKLLAWQERLAEADDPYLAGLDERRRTYVAAGRTFFAYGVARHRAAWEGDAAAAARAKDLFRKYQAQTGLEEPR